MGWSVYSCGMSIGLSEHENIHHEPLNDLEKAKSIKRLMEIRGWNSMRAALTLGIDRKYLMTLLSLVDAPKEVKQLVEDKKIEPSTAGGIMQKKCLYSTLNLKCSTLAQIGKATNKASYCYTDDAMRCLC